MPNYHKKKLEYLVKKMNSNSKEEKQNYENFSFLLGSTNPKDSFMKIFLDYPFDLDFSYKHSFIKTNVLFELVKKTSISFEVKKEFLQRNKFDVNFLNNYRENILFILLTNYDYIDFRLLRFILSYSPDLNIQNIISETPLIFASSKKNFDEDLLYLLLAHSANPFIKDKKVIFFLFSFFSF